MDEDNKTASDIKRELATLKKTKICYLLFYLVYAISDIMVDHGTNPELISSLDFAWPYLIFSVAFFVIRLCTHIYLIKMGFGLQQILRGAGLIRGYYGEILMVVTYIIFFLYLFNDHIWRPTLLLIIDLKQQDCSHAM